MRVLVEPQNDSGAFSLVASSAVAEVAKDDRDDDARFVKTRKALLFELVGDDPVPTRVVVDEPLTTEEQASLVSEVTGVLDLRCGSLLVCGGFDPRSFENLAEGREDDYIRAVSVPPGWYRVTVGTTLGSMNGRAMAAGGMDAWLEQEGDDEPPAGVEYSWLVNLMPIASESAAGALTEPDETGWFPYDAGQKT